MAGSVGRLSLGVFGAARPAGRGAGSPTRSGVALQLTNILRDIREDYSERPGLPARRGPGPVRGDAEAVGDPTRPPSRPDAAAEARFVTLIEFEAARARDWYGDAACSCCPCWTGAAPPAPAAMAGIYRTLLDRIIADPAAVLDGRLSLSGREKAMVAVRSLARRLLPGRKRR